MKERDQEARLGQLKLRELRRKIPGRKVRPIISKSVARPKNLIHKQLKKTPSLLMSNKSIIKAPYHPSLQHPLELFDPTSKSQESVLKATERRLSKKVLPAME